jgi:hypothetical protein
MSSWPLLVRRPDENASERARRRPVQYLITIYNTAETVRALDAPDQHEFNDAHEALQRELRAEGELVETNVFSDIEARVVRVEGGELVVTEGRFISGEVWAGGYYLVECAHLDRAVEIAGRFVEARTAPIEVRRLGFD